MYQINPLKRKVLITAEEVLFHGPTSHTADKRQIEQAIIIAEERFIKPSLCDGLYELFRTQKNWTVVSHAHDINNVMASLPIDFSIGLNIGDMVNAIELVTDQHLVDLWNEYLWKICAECVIYTATPTNFIAYTAQGEMINNPKNILSDSQGSNSATQPEIQWKMNKLLMDRIDPLLNAMHSYLCKNRANFQAYTCKHCEQNGKGILVDRKSPWIMAYNKKKNNNDDVY